eukprot:TRINITY_DN17589_c0_g1_i1.p1 TRINITY_DN17589_c0_g1~~TRINITY_DN17589_c0_g1_i1.p1  ORF type:complete len:470 (+),score=137.15 TRINITY_DN17589_c0_g1_i1:852-2261(+)
MTFAPHARPATEQSTRCLCCDKKLSERLAILKDKKIDGVFKRCSLRVASRSSSSYYRNGRRNSVRQRPLARIVTWYVGSSFNHTQLEQARIEHERESLALRQDLNDIKHDYSLMKGKVEDEKRLREAERERLGYVSIEASQNVSAVVEELTHRSEDFAKEANELRLSKTMLLDQIGQMQEVEQERKFKREKEVRDLNDIIESLTEQKKLITSHAESQEKELGRLLHEVEMKEKGRQEAVLEVHHKETELMRRHEAEVERLKTEMLRQSREIALQKAEINKHMQGDVCRGMELHTANKKNNDIEYEATKVTTRLANEVQDLKAALKQRDVRLRQALEEMRSLELRAGDLSRTNTTLHGAATELNRLKTDEGGIIAMQQQQLREKEEETDLLNQLVRELRLKVQKYEGKVLPTSAANIIKPKRDISTWHSDASFPQASDPLDVNRILQEHYEQSMINSRYDELLVKKHRDD